MDAVFSGQRTVHAPSLALPDALKPNTRRKMDGIAFLSMLPADAVPVAFFDPQYRGVLEKLSHGNEGKARNKRRCALEQMTEATISHFVRGIDRALIPSGHLFLWVDKFHLCQGVRPWLDGTSLDIVDLMTWDKGTFGMGYRTRRRAEYCVILQKRPAQREGRVENPHHPGCYSGASFAARASAHETGGPARRAYGCREP